MTAETYEGKPCRKDGSTTRYRSNRRCVKCSRLEVRYIVAIADDNVWDELFADEAKARALAAGWGPAHVWRATRIR